MSQNVQQLIEQRAYAIWEMEGRPDGRSLAHWLQAEAEAKRSGVMAVTDDGKPVESRTAAAKRARAKGAR